MGVDGIGSEIGKAIIVLVAAAFAVGVVLALGLVWGLPWAWELIKPWIHAWTA